MTVIIQKAQEILLALFIFSSYFQRSRFRLSFVQFVITASAPGFVTFLFTQKDAGIDIL